MNHIAPGVSVLPDPSDFLYVLVPVGVGPQYPAGIFRTPEDAKKAAGRLWPETDGYHYFEVREMALGEVYDSFSKASTGHSLMEGPIPDGKLGLKTHNDLKTEARW